MTTFVTTTLLTNPGIIDRLEQDINDYLSPFGYSLEQLNNERKSALLVAPPHPSSETNNMYTTHTRTL